MIQTPDLFAANLAQAVEPQPRPHYPTSLADTARWAAQHAATHAEAQGRFIHFAVLHVLASAPRFQDQLVLRGAGAMYLFYGNLRSTADLDLIDLSMPLPPSPAQCRSVEADVGKCLADGLQSLFSNYAKWGSYLRNRIQVHVSPRRSLLRFGHINLSSLPEVSLGVADLHFLISGEIKRGSPDIVKRSHACPSVPTLMNPPPAFPTMAPHRPFFPK